MNCTQKCRHHFAIIYQHAELFLIAFALKGWSKLKVKLHSSYTFACTVHTGLQNNDLLKGMEWKLILHIKIKVILFQCWLRSKPWVMTLEMNLPKRLQEVKSWSTGWFCLQEWQAALPCGLLTVMREKNKVNWIQEKSTARLLIVSEEFSKSLLQSLTLQGSPIIHVHLGIWCLNTVYLFLWFDHVTSPYAYPNVAIRLSYAYCQIGHNRGRGSHADSLSIRIYSLKHKYIPFLPPD